MPLENKDISDDAYTIVPSDAHPVVKARQLAYPFHALTSELHLESHQRHSTSARNQASALADTLGALLVPFSSPSPKDYRVLPYSPRYRLSFSLLHEDATAGDMFQGWNITDAISRKSVFSP